MKSRCSKIRSKETILQICRQRVCRGIDSKKWLQQIDPTTGHAGVQEVLETSFQVSF